MQWKRTRIHHPHAINLSLSKTKYICINHGHPHPYTYSPSTCHYVEIHHPHAINLFPNEHVFSSSHVAVPMTLWVSVVLDVLLEEVLLEDVLLDDVLVLLVLLLVEVVPVGKFAVWQLPWWKWISQVAWSKWGVLMEVEATNIRCDQQKYEAWAWADNHGNLTCFFWVGPWSFNIPHHFDHGPNQLGWVGWIQFNWACFTPI